MLILFAFDNLVESSRLASGWSFGAEGDDGSSRGRLADCVGAAVGEADIIAIG